MAEKAKPKPVKEVGPGASTEQTTKNPGDAV